MTGFSIADIIGKGVKSEPLPLSEMPSIPFPLRPWWPAPSIQTSPFNSRLFPSGPVLSQEQNLWFQTLQRRFNYQGPHGMLPPGLRMPGGPDTALIFHSMRKPKRVRTAFSPTQLLQLEDAFDKNHYVVGQERKELAISLNLSETQVKVWFQNRRTKYKRIKTEGGEEVEMESTGRPEDTSSLLDSEDEVMIDSLSSHNLSRSHEHSPVAVIQHSETKTCDNSGSDNPHSKTG